MSYTVGILSQISEETARYKDCFTIIPNLLMKANYIVTDDVSIDPNHLVRHYSLGLIKRYIVKKDTEDTEVVYINIIRQKSKDSTNYYDITIQGDNKDFVDSIQEIIEKIGEINGGRSKRSRRLKRSRRAKKTRRTRKTRRT